MITYNNIIQALQNFADNHFFIQTFTHGNVEELDLNKETDYPILHANYLGADYDTGVKNYNFEIYIVDVPSDKLDKITYQREVISDAEQCAEDLLADITNGFNVFTQDHNYETSGANVTPIEEEGSNVLAGVVLDITITVGYEYDACNAPLTGVTPPSSGECAAGDVRNSDSSYTSTVASGGTLVLPDITVTRVNGTTTTSPSVQDVVCEFIRIDLQNSQETALQSITSYPSLGKFTVSDQTFDILNSLGTVLNSVTAPVGNDVTVNDVNFAIQNQNNTTLQSGTYVVGEDVLLNDTVLTDSNDDAYSTETALTIDLPDTTITSVSTVGGVMTINTPSAATPSGICYENRNPSFATSYNANDSYASFLAGDYDRTPPTYPQSFAQLDYTATQADVRVTPASGTSATDEVGLTMLKENNAFGNKFRYTDDAGNPSDAAVGSNLWAHVDWNNHSWTGATNYYVIDHLTGWGYTVQYAQDGANVNMNGTNDWAAWLTYISTVTWQSTYTGFIPLDLSDMANAHGAKCNPTEVWADNFFEFEASVGGSSRGAFFTGESYDALNFYPIYDSGNPDMMLDLTKSISSGFQSRLCNIFMKRKHY